VEIDEDDTWNAVAPSPPPGPVIGAVEMEGLDPDVSSGRSYAPDVSSSRLSPPASTRGVDWLLLLVTAIAVSAAGTILLAARIAEEYVNLHSRSPLLGWAFLGAISVAVLGVALFGWRSWHRFRQLRDVTDLQQLIAAFGQAVGMAHQDDKSLRRRLEEYLRELEGRADNEVREGVKSLRLRFSEYCGDGMRDMEEFETLILLPLDRKVDAAIESSSAEVSVATALASSSFDAIIVTWQAIRLVGQISRMYAGRPGIWGTLRLFRRGMSMAVFADLADVAADALTEAFSQKALAAVGGRMAEGMANGLLMVRFGEAIKRQCRPAPTSSPSVSPLARLVNAIGRQTRKSSA
jgi:putative membrane protein